MEIIIIGMAFAAFCSVAALIAWGIISIVIDCIKDLFRKSEPEKEPHGYRR
jgi:hypothetical protein